VKARDAYRTSKRTGPFQEEAVHIKVRMISKSDRSVADRIPIEWQILDKQSNVKATGTQ
jgi:hypothetical protein